MTHRVSGHALVTKSARETKELAAVLAKETVIFRRKGAVIFALEGELGSGKTTFTQGFARALGIKESVLSPTFVLMKAYFLFRGSTSKQRAKRRFRHLVHIDCYRIEKPKDVLPLGFKELLKDRGAIVIIEWADRIKKLLPRHTVWLRFLHDSHPQSRVIQIFN